MLREIGTTALSRQFATSVTQRNFLVGKKRIVAAAMAAGLVLMGRTSTFAASLIWDANTTTTGAQDRRGNLGHHHRKLVERIRRPGVLGARTRRSSAPMLR